MYRILIVDDHPLISEGLKKLIQEYKLCNSPELAANGKECLTKLRATDFDIVMLDINLPDCSGIDLCPKIIAEFPAVKILALTSFGEFTIVRKMLDNGASGYLLKNSMPEEIVMGIETVMQGEIFLCHEVDVLLKKESDKHVYLTRRETEILKFITEGFTNSEIADKLFLGEETVKSYRKNLLFKLNARNTASLVKMALEQKLF
jgi:DNA-binding NarL/FixJ family response regulator